MSLDLDPEILTADDIRDDVTKAMAGDLVGPKRPVAHQVGHQRVVARELMQFTASTQVRPTVPNVDDAQLRT